MCDCDAGWGGNDCQSYSCAKITYCAGHGILEMMKDVVTILSKKYNVSVMQDGEVLVANNHFVEIEIAMQINVSKSNNDR